MDILKQLMHEVRKELRLKRLERIAISKGVAARPSGYSNPDNWEAGRLIILIHQESGEVLGEFQEYTYKLNPPTRRLQRVDGGLAALLESPPIEYVHGEHWLHPCPSTSPATLYSSVEIDAMTRRLMELLEGL